MADTHILTDTNPNAVVSYLPNQQAAIFAPNSLGRAARQPAVGYKEIEDKLIHNNIIPWGDENDFPDKLKEIAEKSSIIGETLHKQVNLLYGRGIQPMLVDGYDKGNNEILKPMDEDKFPEVHEFIDRSNLNHYLLEAAMDLYYSNNTFPQLIMSKDRRQIVQIAEAEATYCRWERRDKKTGIPRYCHHNGDWMQYNSKYTTKIPTINIRDPYRWESVRDDNRFHYLYPTCYPTFGRDYYAFPQWYASKKSGWLDVAQAIPQWKKSLMDNQISVRYIIHIPDYWWKWKYKDWDSLTQKEQREKQQEEFQNAEDFLAGKNNAGKTLFTTFKYHEAIQKEFPGWKIEEIGNKWKDGIYLEDSQEASAHKLYALGFDPTLVGFSPGKNHTSSGSGSDKRVAYNMYMAGIHPKKDLLTEPLYFLTRYNQAYADWPKKMRWVFRYSEIKTLNSGEETSEEVTN